MTCDLPTYSHRLHLTEDEVLKMPPQERYARILDAFDVWLAIQVRQFRLRHEELPHLNDAFRDYFADTRTLREDPVQPVTTRSA